MKVKLINVRIATQKSDGTPFTNKNGEAYQMAFIEFMGEEGPVKASMYLGKFNLKEAEEIDEWQVNDEVDIVVEKNGEYNNFRLMNKTDILEERVTKIEKFLKDRGAKL